MAKEIRTFSASVSGVGGKLALVTGGTRGIGRGIVDALSEAGACVIVSGRDEARARAVAEDVEAAGGKAGYIGADLADPEAVGKLIPAIEVRYGKLDILVNNAGIDADNLLIDHPLDDYRRVMEVNVEVPFRLANAVVPHFREKQKGVVINIASILGFVAGKLGGSYVTSKHALVGLTKVMALNWAEEGIRVNAIGPGLIKTDMTEDMWGADGGEAYVRRRIPQGRIGRPRDIGDVAVFLASDAADFIQGQTILVDGGTVLT